MPNVTINVDNNQCRTLFFLQSEDQLLKIALSLLLPHRSPFRVTLYFFFFFESFLFFFLEAGVGGGSLYHEMLLLCFPQSSASQF